VSLHPAAVETFVPPRGDRISFFFISLFIIAIYARPEDIFPAVGHLHLTLALGICATATFLWSVSAGDIALAYPRELCIVLLLTFWFAAGVPFAYWRGGSFDVLTQTWARTLLIFFLLTQTLVTISRIRTVLWAIIFSELAVTAYSLAAPRSETTRWGSCVGPDCGVGSRMSGVNLGILYWNFLGLALAITIPYMAALFIAKRSAMRSLLLAATIACASWMVVLTASRSGTLDVAVSVLLTLLFVCLDTSRGRAIGTALIAALVITIVLAPGIFWSRMATLSGQDYANVAERSAAQSTTERQSLLVRSIDYTLQHPIFGLGLGNFAVASAYDFGGEDAWLASHDTFTEISSEAGVPALLLFLALFLTVLLNMNRVKQATSGDSQKLELNLFARASTASTLSLMFGLFFANITYEYFLYVCPIAIAVAVHRIANRSEQKVSQKPLLGGVYERYGSPDGSPAKVQVDTAQRQGPQAVWNH
jgi:O-antigen ligase